MLTLTHVPYHHAFQTDYYWSDELNATVAENVTVARASQTALRSNPVYTQVTMIMITETSLLAGKKHCFGSHESHHICRKISV